MLKNGQTYFQNLAVLKYWLQLKNLQVVKKSSLCNLKIATKIKTWRDLLGYRWYFLKQRNKHEIIQNFELYIKIFLLENLK